MDVDKQELDEEHADAPATSQKRTKKHNTTEKPSYFDTTPVEGKRQRKTVEVFKPDEPRRKADTSKPQEVRHIVLHQSIESVSLRTLLIIEEHFIYL